MEKVKEDLSNWFRYEKTVCRCRRAFLLSGNDCRLSARGFDREDPDHVFVSLGDLTDRGPAPLECLEFVNSLPAERKLLLRGNHEDMLEDCLAPESFSERDVYNGTMDTVFKSAGQNGIV